MKLKEIKPGMVIHWKTGDEKVALLEELERLGYEWFGTHRRKATYACDDEDLGHAIHVYNDNGWKNITNSNRVDVVTHECSDLIIPEMSAEEALQIANEICKHTEHCADCPMRGNCYKAYDSDKGKTVEVLSKWKSDHEKKESEIETVDICKIIKILPDRKMVVHEEDIKSELPFGGDERQIVEEILKHYCMEHDGEYIAVHEVVSRVKAVE